LFMIKVALSLDGVAHELHLDLLDSWNELKLAPLLGLEHLTPEGKRGGVE
jgi:hypothetical protein